MSIPQHTTHKDFLSSLLALYNTLDDLAIGDSRLPIRLPPPDTGVHPPSIFNEPAARAAGFDDESIAVLSTMPHLDIGSDNHFLEIDFSTYPIGYLGLDLDEGYFSSYREMTEDRETGEVEMMPPSAIALTQTAGPYGFRFIYDTTSRLMTAWEPIRMDSEEEDPPNYFHLPAHPPSEVLGKLTREYRHLDHLITPHGGVFRNQDHHYIHSMPEGWSEHEKKRHMASYRTWDAVRKLREVYVDCGWDVDAGEQKNFRREELIERRARHWIEVVEPLEQDERDIAQEPYMARNGQSPNRGQAEDVFGDTCKAV